MNKNLLITLCAMLFLIVSCKKTDEGGASEVSRQNAEQSINSNMDKMGSDMRDITNSETGELISNFSNYLLIDDVFANKNEVKGKFMKYLKAQGSYIKEVIYSVSANKVNDHRFVFANYTGTYTWNNSNEVWDFTSGGSVIKFMFPSDSLVPNVNDATFTIHHYTDQEFRDEWAPGEEDTTYMPTSLKADIKVGTVTMLSVDFTASYNSEGIPSTASMDAYILPYSMDVTYSGSATSYSASHSIRKDGESLAISASNITITTDGSDNMMLEKVSGFVQYRTLKLEGTIKSAEIDALYQNNDEPTPAQLNPYLSVVLKDASNGSKLGDIVFDYDQDQFVDLFIKFSDGSKELLYIYFEDLEMEFEDFGENLYL